MSSPALYRPPEGAVIIAWRGGSSEGRPLSNLAPTLTRFDGVLYGSAEAFWHALKFPEGSSARAECAQLKDGYDARHFGSRATPAATFTYGGATYTVGSPEHHALFARFLEAKCQQHPAVASALARTGDRPLVHALPATGGYHRADSPALPAESFEAMWTAIRTRVQGGWIT